MAETGAGVMRDATAADQDAVTELVELAYTPWIAVIGRKPRPMLADYAALIAARHVRVWEQGRRILGVLVTWPEAEALYIDNIAVHPDAQRQGIAARLLADAEAQARAAGRSLLRLHTNAKMVSNQEYYRAHHGFAEVSREMTQDSRPVVCMEKRLSVLP